MYHIYCVIYIMIYITLHYMIYRMCVSYMLQILQAGKNTTFDVVFLAREVGDVEYALKILTDRGVFIYNVSI